MNTQIVLKYEIQIFKTTVFVFNNILHNTSIQKCLDKGLSEPQS